MATSRHHCNSCRHWAPGHSYHHPFPSDDDRWGECLYMRQPAEDAELSGDQLAIEHNGCCSTCGSVETREDFGCYAYQIDPELIGKGPTIEVNPEDIVHIGFDTKLVGEIKPVVDDNA